MKKTIILFEKKELCCGCTACMAVCPVSAISMNTDSEGFEYPDIDYERCVGCEKCKKVCPITKK